MKENRRLSTCNWLDLQTLGSQLIIYAQKSPRSLINTSGHSNMSRMPLSLSLSLYHQWSFWSTLYHSPKTLNDPKINTPSVSKWRLRFKISMGFKVIFCTFSTKLSALHSSHEALSGELGVSIVKSKLFGANFSGNPLIWADGTKAHKTVLMCVDTVESSYQLLNK